MIALAKLLRPEDLRTINRDHYLDPRGEYLQSDPLTGVPVDVLKAINRVRNSDLRAALGAIEPFTQETARAAWSHHMSLQCGLHFWPDANHRKAMLSFNLALTRAWGWVFGLRLPEALDLVRQSKAFRNSHSTELTLSALKEPQNAYRQLFRRFESMLVVETETGQG